MTKIKFFDIIKCNMGKYRLKGGEKMQRVVLCAPSRIYFDHPMGRFSYTSMIDYFDKIGIPAIDMSFEHIKALDSGMRAVLYAAAMRAKEKKIALPVCHLSFYMPNPQNKECMAEYQKELFAGIDAAALMGIEKAVVHPIALYSKVVSYGDWVRANIAFLTPVVEYAREKGIRILIENMPSEREAPDNHLYGSCALNISSLAEKLGMGVCWDVGHANVSGFKQSEQLKVLAGKLEVLHVHDNDGEKDSHLPPFDGNVDWEDVAFGLRCCDFSGILDIEVTAWALDGAVQVREDFGKKILMRARRFMTIADLI